MNKKKASVLLFTLLILSVVTILTQQLFRSVWVGTFFNSRMIAKEQAQMLALGGVNLAISQLTLRKPTKKESAEKKGEDWPIKDFLMRVWPNLNRWQTFVLDEKLDGIDGKIKICISCENGKININEAFDFQKLEFKDKFNLLLKGLHIKGKLAEGEILKRLTGFLKARKRKVDDVSELVNVPGFEHLDVFYKPPKIPKTKQKSEPNIDLALQDLFTIWTSDEKIELLFPTDSLCGVFGLRRPQADDAQLMKEKFKIAVGAFKKDWGANWENNWQFMQPIYGPKPKVLKDFNETLSKEFGPEVYSVLSCGEVGEVEQQLLVIIKQMEQKSEQKESLPSREEKKEEKKENSRKKFKILRMYWL